MNPAAAIALVVALVAALIDWPAVHHRWIRVEDVAKPAVIVALIAAAVSIEPTSEPLRWWVTAALVLSLAGDVALLPRFDWFIAGLGSFLIAHVAYIVGMSQAFDTTAGLISGLILAATLVLTVGRRVIAAAPVELKSPVLAYNLAIGAMFVAACASANAVHITAAALFCISDSLLGWGRFIGPTPFDRAAVHVTYHLAQGLFVLGLLV